MDKDAKLTPGQKAVGLQFNPSDNAKVQRLKELFAEAFDIVEQAIPSRDELPTLEGDRNRKMRDNALHEIITAQMWTVKAVTLPGIERVKPGPDAANRAMDATRLAGPNRAQKRDLGAGTGKQVSKDEAEALVGGPLDDDETQPDHAADERVVRTKSTADRVYLLNETKKTRQWVTNPEVLKSLGFSLSDVEEITDEDLLKYQQREALYRVSS